jgi:precorrin-6A/cobalt-precorrin-6A reductase
MKLLILAGTTEARALSRAVDQLPGITSIVSLAGATVRPADHGGLVRSGGFGGSDGLARFLRTEGVSAVVDATHPFAHRISASAAEAAGRCGVPLLRLTRPAWAPTEGDRWIEVDDLPAAADALQRLEPACALLALGHRHLMAFEGVTGIRLVVRSVDPGDLSRLPGAVMELGRGPFRVDDERALLRRHGVGAIVARNSGGDDAKLVAAREVAVPVILVRRPTSAGPAVTSVDEVLAWLGRISA